MDAQGFPLDVPVDHDAAPTIAGVPLGGQVLVEGAEVFGIGGAAGGPLAPDRRVTGAQGPIGHDGDGPAERFDGDVAAPDVGQILVGHSDMAPSHALQTGIGAQPVQAEQQAGLEDGTFQGFVSRRALQRRSEVQP